MGRALHSLSKKANVALDGEPLSEGSLEHILPQSHGGGDDLSNLAIACKRCNNQRETPRLEAAV